MTITRAPASGVVRMNKSTNCVRSVAVHVRRDPILGAVVTPVHEMIPILLGRLALRGSIVADGHEKTLMTCWRRRYTTAATVRPCA